MSTGTTRMTPIRPPFDPELESDLASVPPFVTTLRPDQIAEARALVASQRPSLKDLRRDGTVKIDEKVIPGPEGAPEITILIMSPAQGTGPWPAVYYTHGGGMIMGDRYLAADTLAEWVETLAVVVVSVEYRLAPEHPHPAPVEDCYSGLKWLAGHTPELDINPARILIYGSSAGGGLAAATALMARDQGGPRLSHQILQYPMLDDRMTSPSSRMLDGEGVWDRTSNSTGWTALLGTAAGGPDVSPYAAPARADDLMGLPPAFIDVGGVDGFRDEAIAYATRLCQSGVAVELHMWPGSFHGSDGAVTGAAISQAANRTRLAYLRRILH